MAVNNSYSWAGAFIGATLAARLVLLPVVLRGMANNAILRNLTPEIELHRNKADAAKKAGLYAWARFLYL